MSTATATRPVTLCREEGTFGLHEEPVDPRRTDGLCPYHGKLKDGLIAQNGTDSRRGYGNHAVNPRRHYNYAAWFDGQPHVLSWNVDFAPDTKPMANMLRKAARRRGYEADVQVEGGYHGTITILARKAAAA